MNNSHITDPLLRKVANMTLAHAPEPLQDAVMKAVGAGETLMYSQEMQGQLKQQLQSDPNPVTAVGDGIAKLVALLSKSSNGQIPLRALIPAGAILVCEGLQLMLDAGMIEKVDNATVEEATKEFGSTFLQLLGVTPDKLQQMLSQGGQGAPQEMPQGAPQGVIAGAQGA